MMGTNRTRLIDCNVLARKAFRPDVFARHNNSRAGQRNFFGDPPKRSAVARVPVLTGLFDLTVAVSDPVKETRSGLSFADIVVLLLRPKTVFSGQMITVAEQRGGQWAFEELLKSGR
ncbi:MAG: hypothetical protein WC527_02515 [Candidatus Margulisiibacteriota bacterium]